MTLGSTLLVLFGCAAVELAIQAALLRLICRFWAKRITYRRALATCVAAAVLTVPIVVGTIVWKWGRPIGESADANILLVAVDLLAAAISVIVFRWGLKIGIGKSIVSWLASAVPVTLLALGVAFAFRASVAEAYLIPTGSNATTLLGVHAEIRCANCGKSYFVSMSDRLPDPLLRDRARRDKAAICPYCGEKQIIPPTVPAFPGDRIFAAKTKNVHRGDLVLYHPSKSPELVYVHRLVGLPGERLDIFGGDLFVDGKRLKKLPRESEDLWIAVHDTRFVPKRVADDTPRWLPGDNGSAWKPADQGWTCDAKDGAAHALRFSGRLGAGLAYNAASEDDRRMRPNQSGNADGPFCGDVRLQCHVARCAGNGTLGFSWRFNGRTVTASIAADGKLTLSATGGDAAANAASGQSAGKLNAGQIWAFAVRDGVAYLFNEQEAGISLAVSPEDFDAARREPPAKEPCAVDILATGIDVQISRIELARDVYYLGAGELPNVPTFDAWGTPARPIQLQNDEYFLLGDNSSQSADGRFQGPVKASALVGVAKSIYWPPSRWRNF